MKNPLVILGLIALIVVAFGLFGGGGGPAGMWTDSTGMTHSNNPLWCGPTLDGVPQYNCYENRPRLDIQGEVNRLKILLCLMFGPCVG